MDLQLPFLKVVSKLLLSISSEREYSSLSKISTKCTTGNSKRSLTIIQNPCIYTKSVEQQLQNFKVTSEK